MASASLVRTAAWRCRSPDWKSAIIRSSSGRSGRAPDAFSR
jgi:hypothetical protein